MDSSYITIKKELMVEALMMTFGAMHHMGLSIVEVMEQSIQWLILMYNETEDKSYYSILIAEVAAYINMGFSIPQGNAIIDEIMNKENILAEMYELRRGKKVALTKLQVRSMIGKWKPSKESPMSIAEVVDDIIDKVKNKRIGSYQYMYRPFDADARNIMKSDRYELVITENESFFWDIKNFKFYIFEARDIELPTESTQLDKE